MAIEQNKKQLESRKTLNITFKIKHHYRKTEIDICSVPDGPSEDAAFKI
jgi:hypothetical protein